jgi:hypothetical protein
MTRGSGGQDASGDAATNQAKNATDDEAAHDV